VAARSRRLLDGATPSPNIWHHPDVYELENKGVDPDRNLESAMSRIRTWVDADVLDLGCGTGFHLPRFAADARDVAGIEPNLDLVRLARRRVSGLENVRVLHAVAQDLPMPDASVDVLHARWAYFFGPGCEPGLREVGRVMRRGGAAFVIDNDATRSTFGGWFRRAMPGYDPAAVQSFWSARGWSRQPVDIRWRFERRWQFEAVVRIEFDEDNARRILSEHSGCEVDYAVNIWWRQF
jgi:SAM-dependent methyltransferase